MSKQLTSLSRVALHVEDLCQALWAYSRISLPLAFNDVPHGSRQPVEHCPCSKRKQVFTLSHITCSMCPFENMVWLQLTTIIYINICITCLMTHRNFKMSVVNVHENFSFSTSISCPSSQVAASRYWSWMTGFKSNIFPIPSVNSASKVCSDIMVASIVKICWSTFAMLTAATDQIKIQAAFRIWGTRKSRDPIFDSCVNDNSWLACTLNEVGK